MSDETHSFTGCKIPLIRCPRCLRVFRERYAVSTSTSDELPPDIQAALRDPEHEIPGEAGAIRKVLDWAAVEQLVWDPKKVGSQT